MALEYPPGWRLCNLSGQLMSAHSHPHKQNVSRCLGEPHRRGRFDRDSSGSCGCASLLSRVMPEHMAWNLLCFCLCPCLSWPTEKSPLQSSLRTFQAGIYKHWWDSAEPFLWAEEFKLSQLFLTWEMLQPLQLLNGLQTADHLSSDSFFIAQKKKKNQKKTEQQSKQQESWKLIIPSLYAFKNTTSDYFIVFYM